jgi:hypothetical protein
VEHYVYHSLQDYYGMSEANAAELIQSLEIYHPYGMVGSLPFLQRDGVRFGSRPHPTQLIDLMKKIKTFTEGTDKRSSDIEVIRARIMSAERLVFLGFAFHPMNMDLLFSSAPSQVSITSKVYATTYGLSRSDEDIIMDELVAKGFQQENIVLDSSRCALFFNDYRRSLSFR